jgi:ATP-binding cassette subfamily C protein CydD
MDKHTQKSLRNWLKLQSKQAQRWMTLSILMGLISTLAIVSQAALIASLLHSSIIDRIPMQQLVSTMIWLAIAIATRAAANYVKEIAGFKAGAQIRLYVRQLVLDKVRELGPAYLQQKQAGAWATLILEQVDEMQDYYAKYLPQMTLAGAVPLIILVVVFPQNWAAGVIFLFTAPLVPLFMALVGKKAAEANRKNFKALQRLSGHFYDRLQALTTIRLFNQSEQQVEQLNAASEVFRKRTMSVLKIAFLSSAVLEFFTSVSIAITAVYFGFSFIGELNFGNYGLPLTLFTGLFILILAPEFYQPLRDLGTYYHAKQQAIGAAESLVDFLSIDVNESKATETLPHTSSISIEAENLVVLAHDATPLVGPISFNVKPNEHIALVGHSGAGKSSLVNAILGFLPYEGSLKVNGVELKTVQSTHWHQCISWVGQNPTLLHGTLLDNLNLGGKELSNAQITQALSQSHCDEFVDKLGLDHQIEDRMGGLSVGQAQRIALARSILQQGSLWIVDEPTASLDSKSESMIFDSLTAVTANKTTLMITHQLSALKDVDRVLVIHKGDIVEQGSFNELSHANGPFQVMLEDAAHISDEDKENLDG